MRPHRSLRKLAAAVLAGAALLAAPALGQVGTPGGGRPGETGGGGSQGGGGTGLGGPGDTVPSGTPGEGGSGAGGAESPGDAPGVDPSGPGRPPGPVGGSPAGPASASSRGAVLMLTIGDDPTSWRVWWERNKDAYLDLKRAVSKGGPVTGEDGFFLGQPAGPAPASASLAPTDVELEHRARPALLAVLAEEPGGELARAALLALARARCDSIPAELVREQACARLGDPDQRVAEAAVVALGLAGDFRSLTLLRALVFDEVEGREALGRGHVPRRARALAAYALALAATRTENVDVRRYVARHLALAVDAGAERELAVACLTGVGLAPLPLGGSDYQQALDTRDSGGIDREGQLAWLLRRMQDEKLDPIARAHAATAVGRLAAGVPEEWKRLVVDELRTGLLRTAVGPRELRQACAQALGAVGDADEDPLDQRVRSALEAAIGDADQATRFFAMVALAECCGRAGAGVGAPFEGAAQGRRALVEQLERGRSGAKPWAGLALGVLGRGLFDSGGHPDPEASAALMAALEGARAPEEVGAYAIALGLRRDGQARALLEAKLARFAGDDAPAGDLALALGMLGAGAADEALWALQREAERRPALLARASTALALRGQKSVGAELAEELAQAETLASRGALAGALGLVGDRRAIGPLIVELRRVESGEAARAVFAEALGRVIELQPLPWATPLAAGLDYRAEAELLTPLGSGLVDWD